MPFEWTNRHRRWLDALLILSTIGVGFIVLGFVGEVFFWLGDIILIFFLAWLLAFILGPIVGRLDRLIPFLPRVVSVIVVYLLLLAVLTFVTIIVAGALVQSIRDFVVSVPDLETRLPEVLAPWQRRLDGLGLDQVDLVDQATIFLANLNRYAAELAGPLQQVAVASLGALGNLVLILVLSIYIAIDSGKILAFFFRVVPPAFKEEARLLERSVAESFGGFLRGQAIMGIVYGAIAVLVNASLNLPYLAVTSAIAGILQAIPFFGPFVSWAPPVVVALLVSPDATLPALIAMLVGWFLVMNVLQPRVMEEAVGIHPIVVLGSVLIGAKVAGITGAIFGIPIAAVLSAFFFHYLNRGRDTGPVASRAARRLEAREGRPVRVPREPDPHVDESPVAPPRPASAAMLQTNARPDTPQARPATGASALPPSTGPAE
jgi:predicted PurR-regulated permease PerM